MSAKHGHSAIVSNRRAMRDYMVEDKYEAGLELRGTEVKSLRAGMVSLVGAYAHVEQGEAWLHGMNVQPYEFGNRFNHDMERPRKLLLHKAEILRLKAAVDQKGLTLIPLRLYFVRGRVKVQIGVCRGKKLVDKRETLKRRSAAREANRAIRHASR